MNTHIQKIKLITKGNHDFLKQGAYSYFIIIFNILVSIYAIRSNIETLGKEVYGLWILVFGLFNILNILNFGFTTSTTLSYDKTNPSAIKTALNGNYAALLIQLTFFVIAISVLFFFPEILFKKEEIQPIAKNLLLIMIPGGIAVIISTFFETLLFYNYKKIYFRNTIELIRLGVLYLLFVLGLKFYSNILVLGAIYTIINVILLFFSVKMYKKEANIVFNLKEIDFKFLVKNFNYANSFWVSSICFMVLSQADAIFISLFIKELVVITMYSQCFRLQDITVKFIRKITEIKTPKVLQFFQENNSIGVYNMYKQILLLTLGVSILASFFIGFSGKFLLDLWLKNLIVFDQKLILFMAALCISSSIHFVLWNFINVTKNHVRMRKIALLEISSNLILSYFFITNMGITGLALASIVSQCITIAFCLNIFYSYKKSIKIA